MKKILFFSILAVFCCSCSTPKVNYNDQLYKSYKKYGYHYENDSLNFALSFIGVPRFTLSPPSKQIKSSVIPTEIVKSKKSQVLLMHQEMTDNKSAGFLSVCNYTGIADYGVKRCLELKSKSNVDSINLETNLKFEQIPDHEINSLSYIINTPDAQIGVVEYHIEWSKKKILRLVRLAICDKEKTYVLSTSKSLALESMQSFECDIQNKKKEAAKNLYSSISNSFTDYNYNYLNPLKLIEEYEARKDLSEDDKYTLLFKKANHLSFVGDYVGMMKCRDTEKDSSQWSEEDALKLAKYKPFDAKESTLEETKKYQVVMINENHFNPYCRVFVKGLLDALRKQGFQYFGFETLVNADFCNVINVQKYPLQKLGYYSSEPSMAHLIRSAAAVGFTIFPYEFNEPSDSTTKTSRINHREKSQALNILKILQKDPQAKIIVFTGPGHIQKGEKEDGHRWMANYFKLLSGINPLCIDQSMMNESFDLASESSDYKQVIAQYQPQKSIVLKQNDTFWKKNGQEKHFDMTVFHARSRYENDYPTWLLQNSGSKKYILNTGNLDLSNSLLRVFYSTERYAANNEAIPVINRIVKQNTSTFELMLDAGSYLVVFSDTYGNTLFNKSIKVE